MHTCILQYTYIDRLELADRFVPMSIHLDAYEYMARIYIYRLELADHFVPMLLTISVGLSETVPGIHHIFYRILH